MTYPHPMDDTTGFEEPAMNDARNTAFQILIRHPDCLRDDVSLNGLIEDIAAAIEGSHR